MNKEKEDALEDFDDMQEIEEDLKAIDNENALIEKDLQETEQISPEKVNLVDLIEMPAWKTILLDLVKSEKMDPWNIDVAELADKYLHKIHSLEHSNLKVPANAILACAILVKTKSRYLKISSIEEEDEEEKEMSPQQREAFLEEIPDLASTRAFREGKVTLDELVANIEEILERTDEKRERAKEIDVPQMDLNLSKETIEERMQKVLDIIRKNMDSQNLVMFDNLLIEKSSVEMINTFLPLLFLISQGKVMAWQNEFFGDIFIQLLETLDVNDKE